MMSIVGARVKGLREQRDLSVGQLEYMSKVSSAHIYRIEQGERPNVSGSILAQLARALDTTTDYLLGLTEDPSPRPATAWEKLPWKMGRFMEMVGKWPETLQEEMAEMMVAIAEGFERAWRDGRVEGRALAESKADYSPTLDDEIAEVVALYPDLGPLFERAKEELPEHAVRALLINVQIWIGEVEEERSHFGDIHGRLSAFLAR